MYVQCTFSKHELSRHSGLINWHNYWRKFTKSHILPMRPWQGVFMWRQFSQRLFASSNSASEAGGIEWPCFFAKLNAREKLCGAILEASCRESWHRLRLWPMHILDDGCALLSKCLSGSVLKFGRFFMSWWLAHITLRRNICTNRSSTERRQRFLFCFEFIF